MNTDNGGSTGGARSEATMPVCWVDDYSSDLAPGRVVGSSTTEGFARRGVDREAVIGIDNGALRIEPLINPGWARAGIAYGPFARRNGLAFGVSLLNGHNISRTSELPDGFRRRMWRWAIGSEVERPLPRLVRWSRSGRKRLMWRRVRQWIKTGLGLFHVSPIDENLAVGWFPADAPVSPLQQGNGIIVHAVIPDGGDLWARIGSTYLPTVRGLQNVPMYYVVVLREKGAAYYAASVEGVRGVAPCPRMRLLAIDPFCADSSVYAGIHQSVLGETGFRADTRVFRVQVADLPGFGGWYGSAHAADALVGDGSLGSSEAEIGGCWLLVEGELRRTAGGTIGADDRNTALLNPGQPSGLVHVLVEAAEAPASVALIFRARDHDNFWRFEVDRDRCRLTLHGGGCAHRLPAVADFGLVPNSVNSIQVYDDGEAIRLYLNADLVYGTALWDERLSDSTGVGVCVAGSERTRLRYFEAHPRDMPMPEALDLGAPSLSFGDEVASSDEFDGDPVELSERITPLGGQRWRKEIGSGLVRLTGSSGARVVASVAAPCPGRTAYTIDWGNPDFADVAVTISPPGTTRGQQERGRGGLIFWQDADNYLTLSAFVGDYPAMSIAAFFQVDGFEELYDAVWSNIGRRVNLGVPYVFRVVFDGRRFWAFVDGEPVLYRALRDVYPDCQDFQINRVGIVANWEWGNDTGSLFQRFVAKDKRR